MVDVSHRAFLNLEGFCRSLLQKTHQHLSQRLANPELTSYGLSCLKMHIKFFHKIRVRTAFRDCRAPTWKSRTSHAPIRPQKKWEHTSMKLSAGLPRNCHYTPLERKKRVDFCQWQAASLKLGSVKWMACHFLPKSSAASFSTFWAISMKNCVIGDCFFIHPMNLK